jgi:hypothetical protein
VLTENPFGTRLERVAPYLTSSWIGSIELSPSSDSWYETEIIPELVVNRNGDYDAVLARERNNLGTIWNSWQTSWSGVVDSRTDWGNFTGANLTGTQRQSRTMQTVRTDKTRTGVNTQVSLRIDRVTQGFRSVSKNAIPIVRAKTITITGENFKPKTRLYPFFEKIDVSSYCTPASTDYTTVSTPVAGSPLFTTATGKIEITFAIPDPKVSGNPQFSTGDVIFRFTSDQYGGRGNRGASVGSGGEAIYHATGILDTQQETIFATRNATVVRTRSNQSTSSSSSSSGPVVSHGNARKVAVKYTKTWADDGGYEGSGDQHHSETTISISVDDLGISAAAGANANAALGMDNDAAAAAAAGAATSAVNADVAAESMGLGDTGNGEGDGDAGPSWICTASYNEGLITTSHFRNLKKYGIGLRRNDPHMMKGYDIVGPKWAKLVGKNDFVTSLAEFQTNYFEDIMYNHKLNYKQKLWRCFSVSIIRPILRIVGWISALLKK